MTDASPKPITTADLDRMEAVTTRWLAACEADERGDTTGEAGMELSRCHDLEAITFGVDVLIELLALARRGLAADEAAKTRAETIQAPRVIRRPHPFEDNPDWAAKFFKLAKPGEVCTYWGSHFLFGDLAKLAAAHGVIVSYCPPLSSEYLKHGDCAFVIERVADATRKAVPEPATETDAFRALAEVLGFVCDANGNDPAVVAWHIKNGLTIKEAARRFGCSQMLAQHPCYDGPSSVKPTD